MNQINPNFNPLGNNFNGLILDGVLVNSARGRLTIPAPKTGLQLFNGSPGRLFGNADKFYFNSGTSNNGAYIPPFRFLEGKGNIVGLRDFSEVSLPSNANAAADQAIAELDLIPKGDGTFTRKGFNGTYKIRPDGGIEFSGGFHGNRGNRIDCPPQVYFAGQGWFKLGSVSSGSGLGGVVNSGSDVFTPNQGLGGTVGSVGNSGDVFSSLASMGTDEASVKRTPVYANEFNKIIDGLKKGGTIVPPKVEDLRKDWKAHRDNHLTISKEITKFLAELNKEIKTPENIKLASALFDYHSDYMSNLEDALALNNPQFFKKTGDVNLPDPNEVLSKLQNGEDVQPPSVSDIAKDRASVRKNMDSFRETLKGITDGDSFNKFIAFYQKYAKNYLTARDAELTKFNAASKAFPKEIEIELPLNVGAPQQTNSTNSTKVDRNALDKKIKSYLEPISAGLQSREPSLVRFPGIDSYKSASDLQSLLDKLLSLGATYKPGDAQQGNYNSMIQDLKSIIEEKKAEEGKQESPKSESKKSD